MSKYKVGDTFWRAGVSSGFNHTEVEVESVKVVKETNQYYFVDKSEYLFNCSTRLKKNNWEGKPVIYHTNKIQALNYLLNSKIDIEREIKKHIELIKSAIVAAEGKE